MLDIWQEKKEEVQTELPWLIFRVGEEYYAINTQYAVYIMQLVDEIIVVPDMEYTSCGIIPYMDGYLQLTSLRTLFAIPDEIGDYDIFDDLPSDDMQSSRKREMVIVVQEGDILRGIIVDEVLSIEEILPVEGNMEAGQAVQKSACIAGAGRTEHDSGRIILLIDGHYLLERC